MSTIDERPAAADNEPEEPTSRPPASHRMRAWLARPYATHIVILTGVLSVLLLPIGWVGIAVMNGSGGPASETMVDIQRTALVLTLICTPLMAFTLAVMFYSLLGWGRVTGDEVPTEEGPAIRTNRTAVVAWMALTTLMATFFVVYGTIELANMQADQSGAVAAYEQPSTVKPVQVNVMGQQWLWTFSYPEKGNLTSDVLYVPVNTPIEFSVTSKDVIHSFWVVELGVKIDANPGAITTTGVTPTKLGTFNIRCAELCGLHHAFMQTQIRVVTQEQFDTWTREMGGGTAS